ncbi:MAG: hypothetical protein CVU47_02850 [Chloroflexi bacterium HGW-Chloroflexi-9]|nr:MAG: hypothetical protein CVU47_02850 [Chloroflexi bacterium HGW-Chloroflexi-9]
MTEPDSAPPSGRRGGRNLGPTFRILLGILVMGGLAVYLTSDRGADEGAVEVAALLFEPARATEAAHAALIGLADLPGSGWTVTATDDFEPSPPSDVESCGASEAREAEIDARYEPGRVARANVTFVQIAADALLPTTVEVEVRVYGSAADAQGVVATYAEFEGSSTAAQCLADTVQLEVVTGESLAPIPAGGAAVAYRVVAPAGAPFGDIRFEHYLWPVGNGAVSVVLTGVADQLDMALVQPVVEGAVRAASAAGAAAPTEGARRYVPNMTAAVSAIQNELAEVEVAKRLGDDLAVGAAAGTLADVRAAAAGALERLDQQSPPEELRAYHEAARAWASDIVAAAEGGTAVWPARPDAPAPSAPAVAVEQQHELVDLTLRRLAPASEFGALALAREDRTAARFVASRAAVQARFLQGLVEVSEASTCTQSGCLAAALPAASAIAQATASLAAPGSIDAASWGVVWDEASLAITPGGAPIPEAGIAIGEGDAAPISETVRLYAEACRAGGGLVDDTGGVTALPTTEGGWTCWSADRACYHHLTVSGWLYANGGTGQGCPPVTGFLDRVGFQQMAAPDVARAVVPVGGGAPPANGDAPAVNAWDGTYQVLAVSPFVCDDGDSGEVVDWEGAIVVIDGIIERLSPTIGADGRVTVVWSADGLWLSEQTFTFTIGADGVPSFTSEIRVQQPFVPPPDYTGPARQVTVCTWTSTGVRENVRVD